MKSCKKRKELKQKNEREKKKFDITSQKKMQKGRRNKDTKIEVTMKRSEDLSC